MSSVNPRNRRVKNVHVLVRRRNDCGDDDAWIDVYSETGVYWNRRDAVRRMKSEVAEFLDAYDIDMKRARANYKCLYSEWKDAVHVEVPMNNTRGQDDCIVADWKIVKI